MRYMADNTPGNLVTISSDHDFRTELLLDFYKRRFSGEKQFKYVPRESKPTVPPEWFIFNAFDPNSAPIGGYLGETEYAPARTFPAYGPSGISWVIYKKIAH
jgi:hypothetical protein